MVKVIKAADSVLNTTESLHVHVAGLTTMYTHYPGRSKQPLEADALRHQSALSKLLAENYRANAVDLSTPDQNHRDVNSNWPDAFDTEFPADFDNLFQDDLSNVNDLGFPTQVDVFMNTLNIEQHSRSAPSVQYRPSFDTVNDHGCNTSTANAIEAQNQQIFWNNGELPLEAQSVHDQRDWIPSNANIGTIQNKGGSAGIESSPGRTVQAWFSTRQEDYFANATHGSEMRETQLLQEDDHNDSCSLIISGLPLGTTKAHLDSLLAWSKDFIKGRMLPNIHRAEGQFEAAALYFSSPEGAKKAKELLHGMPNIEKTTTMTVTLGPIPHLAYLSPDKINVSSREVTSVETDPFFRDQSIPGTSFSAEPCLAEPRPATKRHKFTAEDKVYLETQFHQNPKPPANICVEIATHLGTERKQIRTWFNNYRQRQREADRILTDSLSTAAKTSRSNKSTIPPPPSMSQKNLKLWDMIQDLPHSSDVSLSTSSVASWLSTQDTPSEADAMDTIRSVAAMRVNGPRWQPLDPSPVSFFKQIIDGANSTTSVVSRWMNSKSVHSASSAASSHSRSSAYSSRSQSSNVSRRNRKASHRRAQKPAIDTQITTPGALRLVVNLTCYRCNTPAKIEFREGQVDLFDCPKCTESLSGEPNNLGLSRGDRFKIRCSHCGAKSAHAYRKEGRDIDLPLIHYCLRCGYEACSMLFSCGYQCTFCQKRHGSKFAWERHEKVTHEPQGEWICCKDQLSPWEVLDTTIDYQTPEIGQCTFCWTSTAVALPDHFAKVHKFQQCMEQPRTFFRKDQLSQHLKVFHKCAVIDHRLLSKWHRPLNRHKTYHCGICGATLYGWSTRMRHIGEHWDDRYDMKYWMDGCEKGSPEIAPGFKGSRARPLPSGEKVQAPTEQANPLAKLNGVAARASRIWSGIKNILA
ncbi:hypothetical protein G7Y89_g13245 [Cudoniella acicularis]|uniref:Homeobox domain-containing protein n=1 Tax=Cudoniella acicularis TaxID=354080 RepID=A0A8H4RA03_9HELO|nr:hypothetical protein G7Y89_g13245 [Cudoniella acicularis]